MRHGESAVNVTQTLSCRTVDEPLTENGARQAEQAAAWLAGRPIRRVFASPLLRAKQTADAAAKRLGLGYAVAEELREIDCGSLEGRRDPEAWRLFEQVILRWVGGDLEAGFERGETGRQAVERFARFMRRLPVDEGDTLAVGHGGIFTIALLTLCYDFRPMAGRHLSNTGLVLVERTPAGFSCVTWDLSEHLDQPSITGVPEGVLA